MARGFAGVAHAHACKRCVVRYEDACQTPAVDDLCTGCKGGKVWQLLIDSRLPRECCRENSRIVTKDEVKIYHLAGTRLWFICTRCARTHPFDPRKATP